MKYFLNVRIRSKGVKQMIHIVVLSIKIKPRRNSNLITQVVQARRIARKEAKMKLRIKKREIDRNMKG